MMRRREGRARWTESVNTALGAILPDAPATATPSSSTAVDACRDRARLRASGIQGSLSGTDRQSEERTPPSAGTLIPSFRTLLRQNVPSSGTRSAAPSVAHAPPGPCCRPDGPRTPGRSERSQKARTSQWRVHFRAAISALPDPFVDLVVLSLDSEVFAAPSGREI